MTTSQLPEPYRWLLKEDGPALLDAALDHYGTKEIKGAAHNQKIIDWAKELGGPVAEWFKNDEEAWCGLFMAVCIKHAGFEPPKGFDAIRALKYSTWGKHVVMPLLGDVLVFNRSGGGHVGIYVGEDTEAFHVLGGNQADSVCITRISKDRLFASTRPPYKTQPKNLRRVHLKPSGGVSQNEA